MMFFQIAFFFSLFSIQEDKLQLSSKKFKKIGNDEFKH